MSDTHPNAYLAEAQTKRDQANILLAEAEALEEQARAITGEPKLEDVAEAAAVEDDEPKQYSEDDPHRHDKSKKK